MLLFSGKTFFSTFGLWAQSNTKKNYNSLFGMWQPPPTTVVVILSSQVYVQWGSHNIGAVHTIHGSAHSQQPLWFPLVAMIRPQSSLRDQNVTIVVSISITRQQLVRSRAIAIFSRKAAKARHSACL